MSTYLRTWRVSGAIIRQRGRSYQVETHYNGLRKRQTFKTVEEAESYAKRMAQQIREEGEAALSITGADRLDALQLLQAFPTRREQDDAIQAAAILSTKGRDIDLGKPQPSPLAEAVRFWLAHHPDISDIPTIEEALAAYLEHKQERRESTKTEIRQKISRIAKAFPNTPVSEITSSMLDGWLTDNLTLPNRKRYLNVYRTFWKFLGEKYKLEADPTARIMLPITEGDQSEVTAYTVEEARRILHAASASPRAAQLVPVIALGLFAGLRPSEIQGLDWSDVSLASKRVRVSPETAKRRRSRYVDMPDNLVEWLTPHVRESGPVSLPLITYRRERAKVMEAAGCTFLKDGFRHSFGTYHLAAFENPVKTALIMGHRANQDLVFTNYRKLVTREEGQAFWQIRPPRLIEAGH
ncbi:MAG: tyrosine-type recombinase/integrase [Lentisphaerae bacterium]|jgi:integrase|nr:tyrosine-type recombinase/integrase [Lentisphaerota bacterium]